MGSRKRNHHGKEGGMAKRRQSHNPVLKSVRKHSRQGTSLVLVICASAFLLAFALAMVYTASLMMARANRRLEQERCYQLAKSFAEVLDAELGKYTDPKDTNAEESFYLYACKFLEGDYGEYDPDHPEETVFHYTAGVTDVDENYGSVRVVLYKEVNQDPEEEIHPEGEIDNSEEKVDGLKDAKLQRYIFTVEVIATLDGISHHYKTEYRQNATYDVEFSHNGILIYWGDDDQWHTVSGTGGKYEVPAGDKISYRYKTDSDNIKACSFEKAYGAAEGGSP